MRVLPLRTRIIDECPIFGGRVHIVASILDAFAEEPDELPVAFVTIPTERAAEESTDQLSTQAVFGDFDVVIVGGAPDPGAGAEPLEDAAEQLVPAIQGWQLSVNHNPTLYEGCEPWLLDGAQVAVAYSFSIEKPVALRESP